MTDGRGDEDVVEGEGFEVVETPGDADEEVADGVESAVTVTT